MAPSSQPACEAIQPWHGAGRRLTHLAIGSALGDELGLGFTLPSIPAVSMSVLRHKIATLPRARLCSEAQARAYWLFCSVRLRGWGCEPACRSESQPG